MPPVLARVLNFSEKHKAWTDLGKTCPHLHVPSPPPLTFQRGFRRSWHVRNCREGWRDHDTERLSMQCHTSAPSMPRKASDLLRCVNLVVFNYKYIHNVDTSYTILEWNAILRNVGKGVPKKRGQYIDSLMFHPSFSSFFHRFFMLSISHQQQQRPGLPTNTAFLLGSSQQGNILRASTASNWVSAMVFQPSGPLYPRQDGRVGFCHLKL